MNDERIFLRDLAARCARIFDAAVREGFAVDHKGDVDLVTEVDRELERVIVAELRGAFPQETIVAEEGGGAQSERDAPVWYVDPLDGTTNFVHGFPFYGPSVGRWVGGVPQCGMVFAPALDELFLARAGEGATVERPRSGEPARTLQLRGAAHLREALCATGFPYDRSGARSQLNQACHAAVLERARGVRRAGAAALDLCYVAAGRLDCFWEMGLAPWDVAAGILIAREAGARVTDFAGGETMLHGGRICAGSPGAQEELLKTLSAVHRDPAHWSPGGRLRGPQPLEES